VGGLRGAEGRFELPGLDLHRFVRDTLAEDLGPRGDITSEAVIPEEARLAGVMNSRDEIVVTGLPVAEAFFRWLDPGAEVERLADEGARVRAGTALMRLRGRARALLAAERSALNTLRVPTEASGGVTVETIRSRAETGVTFVSVGRITQSAPAADIGLDFLPL
jgi:nicotinate-nucleotide pyrophosphorylase (carboxylating)